MKRKILISTLLFLTGLVTHAQDLDIKPSQQAQGILESKNGMVDHATGLFHYKVPLYEIKSGNFTLPISLNYVAKGVKFYDKPGVIGYNWTLNTGGIVTRTIRGGLADEELEKGYVHNAPLDENDVKKVNQGEIDGEADIFTAIFNGQSVSFILKKEGTKIVAVPLQYTNVKIECIYGGTSEIDGWIITDDLGNKYTYKQKEKYANVVKEKSVGINNIFNKLYVSSWYLTKIEPLNAAPIEYKYSTTTIPINIYDEYTIDYRYGKPLEQKPLDFNKYRKEFQDYIILAQGSLNFSVAGGRFFAGMDMLNYSYYGPYFDPNYFLSLQNIDTNAKIMGILSDMCENPWLFGKIVSGINEIMAYYKNDWNTLVGQTYLQNAKSVILRCFTEKEIINKKTRKYYSTMRVLTPILHQIVYSDRTLEFSYNNSRIEKIGVHGIFKNNITGVKFSYLNSELSKLSFVGSDFKEFDFLKFNYHNLSGNDLVKDDFGYHCSPEALKDKYLMDNKVKHKSLKTIENSGKGKIELDYENNTGYSGIYMGGMRIKNIVTSNDVLNVSDTVKYSYPIVYPVYSYHKEDRVNYGIFRLNGQKVG